ncbi:MAG: TonB family protein [bacterium]|nr:TonB family protein [bacterium]
MAFFQPRVLSCFLIALLIHFSILSQMYLSHAQYKKKLIVLEGVELIEPLPAGVPESMVIEKQKKPTILEFSKKALEGLNKLALPTLKLEKQEKSVDMAKKLETTKKVKDIFQEQERLMEKPQDLTREEKKPALARLFDKEMDRGAAEIKMSKEMPGKSKGILQASNEPGLKIEEVGRRRVEVAREEEKPRGISDIFGSSQGKGISTDRQLSKDVKVSPAANKQIIPLFGGSDQKQSSIKMERGVQDVRPQGGKSSGSPALSQLFGKQGGTGDGKGGKEGEIALQGKPAAEPARGVPGGVEKGKGIGELFGEKGKKEEVGVAKVQAIKKLTEDMVQITGQLSKRGKKKIFLPIYPAWAEKEGIEADVSIHITVSPQGEIVDAYVERTSGQKELDKLALIAIRNWVFVALSEDTVQENQWGIIIFKFRLQ